MRAIGWAYSSAGEHYIDIVGVTGSIPVTPTIRFSFQQYKIFNTSGIQRMIDKIRLNRPENASIRA